jgi:hypothetical protein
MELALNLVWAMLAAVMIRLWVGHAKREGANRLGQCIALALILSILFPVISVTDDLQLLQNPAESDIYNPCTRRDHAVASQYSTCSAGAALPSPVFAGQPFGFLSLPIPSIPALTAVDNPALTAFHDRPPPVA